MGTPTYMSPEQAAGEAVDSRSDVYALGIVAYEMLTGAPPFTGPAPVVASKQIVDAPTPIQTLRPDLPAGVAAAIMRALEKTPEGRWQTGAAFGRALLGEPATASAAVPPRRTPRRLRAVVLLALSAVAALGIAFWRRSAAPAGVNPRLSMLVLPFDNLREEPDLAWLREGSVSMLSLAMGQWRDLTVVDQNRVHDLVSDASVDENDPIGLDLGRRLARRAGAWTVVLGDFDRGGDSLRLTARAYDVASGRRLDVVQVAGPSTGDIRPLFDELATRLLDLSGAPAAGRTGLATATTGSLEAYRAYLRGLEYLNHWDLAPAEREFTRAVRLDSTFALAYYRLALTRGWVTGVADTTARHAVQAATRFSERLPERERRMIGAYRAMLDGDYTRSQELYAGLLSRDSSDADAWYGLGDAVFHDSVAGGSAAGMTRSLRAFRKALSLDQGYALAYEHITALLTSATRQNASYALVGPDSLMSVFHGERAVMDSLQREAARTRARGEAVQTARTWVQLQPGTARARRALFEALIATSNFAGASEEARELRRLLPAEGKELASFFEARVRFAAGDLAGAADLVRGTTAALADRHLVLPDFGRELVTDVATGANMLAYQGDIEGATRVLALADEVRRAAPGTGLEPGAWELEEVWEWSRLAQLYAAGGGPDSQVRRLWISIASAARRASLDDRSSVAGSGASAATAMLLGQNPDPQPLAELESLTGRAPPRGVRALLALSRGDSVGARKALGDSLKPIEEKGAMYWGFAAGDPRPLEAEAWYQLGEFQTAIDRLQGFDEEHLAQRGFDARWALLGRVHLLRGLANERLGRPQVASTEFRKAIARWRGAGDSMLAFVQQAQAGLGRLKGSGG
jgi:tetratricopeptide (TPR) repeat protein